MMANDVLLVEDDEVIGGSLVKALRGDSYNVAWVPTGEAAIETASETTRLVVLDLGLPDCDGLDVCRRLRNSYPSVQILILTARQEEVDVVLGLDAGADDYQTKPFRLAELMARIRARLRYGAMEPECVQTVGSLHLDTDTRRVFVQDSEVALRPKEFDLLALLVARAGKVVTREEAISRVWDENWFGSTKTLDIHISALRRKVDNPNAASRITTIRGVGYRLEVETAGAAL